MKERGTYGDKRAHVGTKRVYVGTKRALRVALRDILKEKGPISG